MRLGSTNPCLLRYSTAASTSSTSPRKLSLASGLNVEEYLLSAPSQRNANCAVGSGGASRKDLRWAEGQAHGLIRFDDAQPYSGTISQHHCFAAKHYHADLVLNPAAARSSSSESAVWAKQVSSMASPLG